MAPNLDTPEAGLDGLMQVNHTDLVAPEMRPKLQVLLCKDRIGFKPDRSHLVVFMTDAPSHIAGDGLIGGLWRPYSHTCQLEPRPQTDGSKLEVYWGLDHDYPSLSEVNYLLEKEELRVLFATPKPILPLYEMLVETKVNSEVRSQDDIDDTVLFYDNRQSTEPGPETWVAMRCAVCTVQRSYLNKFWYFVLF